MLDAYEFARARERDAVCDRRVSSCVHSAQMFCIIFSFLARLRILFCVRTILSLSIFCNRKNSGILFCCVYLSVYFNIIYFCRTFGGTILLNLFIAG